MHPQDFVPPKVEKLKQHTEVDVLIMILNQLREINDRIGLIARALQGK